MIDLHSHILPELDDGSQSLRESMAMARVAVDSGVTAMVATPHCMDDRAREVHSAWLLLRDALAEAEIPLKLYLGMEVFGTRDTVRFLRERKLFTLNGSYYPLIEFAFRSDGREETRILQSVIEAGYRPLVAHPERYSYVRRNPELINIWQHMGCLFQVNRGSLLGRFGNSAQDMAFELVERGFAAVVASDAHTAHMRTPWMADVKELLAREVSAQTADCLLQYNPERILRNEQLPPAAPDWF